MDFEEIGSEIAERKAILTECQRQFKTDTVFSASAIEI
jgi:hypothetical protein